MDMAQINGLFKEHDSPGRQRNVSGRLTNGSVSRLSLLNSSETSPAPEQLPWSSAIGHASTGKSGRVIERLQGDIDRLHREKQLLKVRFEEAEKASEALHTQNQYLQDRNSNYEQSHEASQRQLERKERQVEELRQELRREKAKTARAEETARAAAESEENWRTEAHHARSTAAQKETEYETMVMCRNRDNERHQGGLNKTKEQFEALLRQREGDLEKHKKFEILAEQQRETIGQLEELTKRLNANFRLYRREIDAAIGEMRAHVSSNDEAVLSKLEEMQEITSKMRWVMNVEKEINQKSRPPATDAR